MCLVPPAWEAAMEQNQEARHALFGQWTVADILAREGLLVHLCTHVARIDPVDAPIWLLGRQYVRYLLQRCLGGSIAAPAFVCLHGGVAGNVDDGGPRLELVLRGLDESQGSDHVGLEH